MGAFGMLTDHTGGHEMRVMIVALALLAGCGPQGAQIVATSPGTVIVERPWFTATEQQMLDTATAECRRQGRQDAVMRSHHYAPRFTYDADRATFECR
jgi:hypothetical protein